MADTSTLPAMRKSITETMANRFNMEAGPFEQTVRATCGAEKLTREQFAAFLLVAYEHGLNPITREIFAFPGKNGIVPVVSVDGWLRIINTHPQMDGMELEEVFDDAKKLTAVTAKIYRKDRRLPIALTEYLSECDRGTDVWKKWPARMLRHKALIQCARYAFGFAGIYDQDEAERIVANEAHEGTVIDTSGEIIPEMNSSQAKRGGLDVWITQTLLNAKTPADIDAMFEDFRWKCVPPSWHANYAEMIEHHKARVSAPADYNPLSIVLKAIEKANSGEALHAIQLSSEWSELRDDARAEAGAAIVNRARELADD